MEKEKEKTIQEFLADFKDPNGDALDKHVHNTLIKLLMKHPTNWMESFEDYSLRVKKEGYNLENLDVDDNNYRMKENYTEVKKWGDNCLNFLGKEKGIGGGDGEDEDAGGEEEEIPTAQNVSNLLEDFRIFQWAGIHFGEEELFLLQKSLANETTTQGKALTFFGKILGSEKDYYIATMSGEGDEKNAEEPLPEMEEKGKGANKLDFLVCNSPFDKWVVLPLVSPQDIRESRRIKHIFTGELESEVITSPPFSRRKEKYLLKAQLVRMLYCTRIYPYGKHKLPEPDQIEDEMRETNFLQDQLVEVDEEEYKKPTHQDLINMDIWVHEWSGLLKEGRRQHLKPEGEELDDDAVEKIMKAKRIEDPFPQRLQPVKQDTPIDGLPFCWNIKHYGDMSLYPIESKTQNPMDCHGCSVIESLIWPGWKMAIYKGRYFSCYVGYGQKFSTGKYYSTLVYEVMNEPDEYPLQPEPTPLEEPVEQAGGKGGEENEEDDD